MLRGDERSVAVLQLLRGDMRRLSARDPHAARLIGLVAAAYEVPVRHMLGRSRRAEVVLARHIAIYLLNTILQRPLYEAAGLFGRDRKSARYACARVEDARDAPAFDREIERLEGLITAEEPEVRYAAG